MTPEKAADYIRGAAEHFMDNKYEMVADRDNLIRIQYKSDDSRWKRFKDSWRWFTPDTTNVLAMTGDVNLAWRFHMWWYTMTNIDKNLPDAVLSGGIIVPWIEDAWYIQIMHPPVGSKVADFLEAEPDNPYAIAIANEIGKAKLFQK